VFETDADLWGAAFDGINIWVTHGGPGNWSRSSEHYHCSIT